MGIHAFHAQLACATPSALLFMRRPRPTRLFPALLLAAALLSLSPGHASLDHHFLDVSLAECSKLFDLLRAGKLSDDGSQPTGALELPGPFMGYTRNSSQCWSHVEWKCFQERRQHGAGAGAGVDAVRIPPAVTSAAPSTALRRALRHYRRYWANCNAHETSAEVLQNVLEGKSPVCKYVFWTTPSDGLGNRAVNLISTFAFALATKRILLVDSDPDRAFSRLVCEPFPDGPSWKLPNMEHIWNGRKALYFTNLNCTALEEAQPAVVSLELNHGSRYHFYGCKEFVSWLDSVPVVQISGNQYFLPMLYSMPHLGEHMLDLFPSGKPFAVLASILIRPSNAVWERVSQFLLTEIKAEDQLVGVQLRHRLPNLVTDLATCTPRVLNVTSSSQPLPVIYASMEDATEDITKAMAEQNVTAAVRPLTSDRLQQSGSLQHNERAMFDIAVLALGPRATFITGQSTFGYLVAGLSDGASYYMDHTCTAFEDPCFQHEPHPGPCCSLNSSSIPSRTSPEVGNCWDSQGITVRHSQTLDSSW